MDNLNRFTVEHKRSFDRALAEIKSGRKRSHWMWYIFPQISGLGDSYMSRFFAIKSLDEARAFIEDEYLGGNLREISNALLTLENNDARYVMGLPDNRKLRSCMTLFELADPDCALYARVLEEFFGGKRDHMTLDLIK